MKRIAVLGSTGSIGTQALEVAAAHPDRFRVVALAAHHNDRLLAEQLDRFRPALAVLADGEAADRLRGHYRGPAKIMAGEEGLIAAATLAEADTVLTSLVGFAGLRPTLAAIEAGKNIALANKETLVAAGELVTAAARRRGVAILPVDSEHSAILQCLQGEGRAGVRRLILTASGGPFRERAKETLPRVTVSECLKHPNWSMGRKITVDSATLANKGLEVIEARWLFDMDYDAIDVVVHPQSIIHSMVEFVDGSVMAQLGRPDMRLPIQYAFSFPDRWPADFARLDFTALSALTFAPPDTDRFPALAMGYEAGRRGGTAPCVFNAANEAAVNAFLSGEITFTAITASVRRALDAHADVASPTLADLCAADEWARAFVARIIPELK
ncbi:1-deoxy-D-xylulose-5-phosphate reductoisomerase [Anaeroselena agilis]|uniref:1-deoxy-D-xylulose 5-phosphate reductoisomerase n=1 Tax=Anaeroselena agilis TaxID=3063788 RepID=A0ABU3NY35_9FIRM|nr:1-deoxy-D-xylulose-5-phosphate reductoisomerase [Selenomonadales bacterium 4137-cl]